MPGRATRASPSGTTWSGGAGGPLPAKSPLCSKNSTGSSLRIAVRSVQAQEDPDWRLTVVDDGYPDESVPRWFEELDDERICYQRNAANLGANGNYRKCVDLIEHDVAVLMGADDVMLPGYVSTIKKVHRAHPEAGIIQVGVDLIDESGKLNLNALGSLQLDEEQGDGLHRGFGQIQTELMRVRCLHRLFGREGFDDCRLLGGRPIGFAAGVGVTHLRRRSPPRRHRHPPSHLLRRSPPGLPPPAGRDAWPWPGWR